MAAPSPTYRTFPFLTGRQPHVKPSTLIFFSSFPVTSTNMATYDRLTLAAWTVMDEDLDLDLFLSKLQQNMDDARRTSSQLREPKSSYDKALLNTLAINTAVAVTHTRAICEKLAYLDQIDQPLASFIRSVYLERQSARKINRESHTSRSDVDPASIVTNAILALVDTSLSLPEDETTETFIERHAGVSQMKHSEATPDATDHQSGSSVLDLFSKEIPLKRSSDSECCANQGESPNEEQTKTDLLARALCEAIDAVEDDGMSVKA